jgi:hypothetical protein
MSHVPDLRHVKDPIRFSVNYESDSKIWGEGWELFPPLLVEVCMMLGASGDECGNLSGVRIQ